MKSLLRFSIAILPAMLLLADVLVARLAPIGRFHAAFYFWNALLAALLATQFGLIGVYAAMGSRRWFARLPIAAFSLGLILTALAFSLPSYHPLRDSVPLLIGCLGTIYLSLAIARRRGVAVTLRQRDESTPPAVADEPFRFTVTHVLLVVTYMALFVGGAGLLKPRVHSATLGFYLITEGIPVLLLAAITVAALWAALSRARPLIPVLVLLVLATPTGAWKAATYPRTSIEDYWWFMATHGLHALLTVAVLLLFRGCGYRIALPTKRRDPAAPLEPPDSPPVKLRWMLAFLGLLALGLAAEAYAYFREARAEQALRAAGEEVTPAFTDIDGVRTVYLSFPSADDATLRHVRGFFSLRGLNLRASRITDAGLEHVGTLSKLEDLTLDDTVITDAGLHHLRRMTSLKVLSLDGTQVEGPGLTHLNRLPSLRLLSLDNTRIGDQGLAHIQGLPGLTLLSLQNTSVTDAGVDHVKALTRLRQLDLRGTAVTDAGVKDLQEALPNLEVLR